MNHNPTTPTIAGQKHLFFTEKAKEIAKAMGLLQGSSGLEEVNLKNKKINGKKLYNTYKAFDLYFQNKIVFEVGTICPYFRGEKWETTSHHQSKLSAKETIEFAKLLFDLYGVTLYNLHYEIKDKVHPFGLISKDTKLENLEWRF